MTCIACAVGLFDECFKPNGSQCTGPVATLLGEPKEGYKRSGPYKDDDEVRDPKSTGRKRAAVLYPLEEGMICEWAKLKLAGGGAIPIVGCSGNYATARHHGPDKDTLNNEKGNVHRTCVWCHNRWHTANDPLYKAHFNSTFWLPHNTIDIATEEEILASDAKWSKTTIVKAQD